MVGALQYLTFTCPDLAFSVNQLCQFMSKPSTSHLEAAKRVLRYVRGTLDYGIHFSHGPLTLLPLMMLIGQVTQRIIAPLLVIWIFLAQVPYSGPPRSNPLCHAL